MSTLSHKLQYSITSSSGTTSITGSDIEGPNSEITPGPNGLQFAANSSNAAFSMAFNSAKLQDVFFVANQNCSINTVGANSTTLSLVAGVPFVWGISTGYGSNPFNGVVNSATLTCNAATNLKFLIGTS